MDTYLPFFFYSFTLSFFTFFPSVLFSFYTPTKLPFLEHPAVSHFFFFLNKLTSISFPFIELNSVLYSGNFFFLFFRLLPHFFFTPLRYKMTISLINIYSNFSLSFRMFFFCFFLRSVLLLCKR